MSLFDKLPSEIKEEILIQSNLSYLHPKYQTCLDSMYYKISELLQKKLIEAHPGNVSIYGNTPQELYETIKIFHKCNCCPRHQKGKPKIELYDFLNELDNLDNIENLDINMNDLENNDWYGEKTPVTLFKTEIDTFLQFILIDINQYINDEIRNKKYKLQLYELLEKTKNVLEEFLKCEFALQLRGIYFIKYNLDILLELSKDEKIYNLHSFREEILSFHHHTKYYISKQLQNKLVTKKEHHNYCNCGCRQRLRWILRSLSIN